MRIFFLSSEIYPYSKTGGLADVSSALPKAIRKHKHKCIVITPYYEEIVDKEHTLVDSGIVFDVEMNDQIYHFSVFNDSKDGNI